MRPSASSLYDIKPHLELLKLADLEDNSRLSRTILRLDRIDHDLARIRRYVLSYKFLTDQITEAQYRATMEGAG